MFREQREEIVKVLWFDVDGLILLTKRLHRTTSLEHPALHATEKQTAATHQD